MAFTQQQVAMLAKAIVDGLVRTDLVELTGGHLAAESAVAGALDEYGKAEASLSKEAERRAEEEIRKLGSRGVGLDRRRIVQMIKQKLAEEKGFPL